MITKTAEEFFRKKIKELQPFREVITLANEMITAEQGMRWAHEFKQLPGTYTLPKGFTEKWVLMDDNGILFTGTESEMRKGFDIMTRDIYSVSENDELMYGKYLIPYVGELKLVEIHNKEPY